MIRLLKWCFHKLSGDWYRRLSELFIGLMLLNTISIFEGYWWEETFAVATSTVLLAIAVQWLLPRSRRLLQISIQFILAIAMTIHYTNPDKVYWRAEGAGDWLLLAREYLAQLEPIIWIALSLLILYILFNYWVTTRSRIFGFIGMNLISLTIADSFSPIWLWDEVAWVVCMALLWLSAAHLHKLERDHPGSWKEMIEYPVQLLLPVAIVLSVLMTIGLMMPTIAPILQDPYTIWKESKGESVNDFLGDKGSQSPSSSSRGDTRSGYGRDDTTLGGGFNYDYSPVMTVSTSHKSYWRGESKIYYSGQGWDIIDDGQSPAFVRQAQALPMVDNRELADTMDITQLVTMIRKDSYPVLFAASPPAKVNWINDPDLKFPSSLIWSPSKLELRWTEPDMKYPESYSVTSEVTVLDVDGLRKAKAGWEMPEQNYRYLQLPQQFPERVKQLAEQITSQATNDYDRAKLIEQYLQTNYLYTNKPDLSKLSGASTDFTEQFLFELMEGYCDYFSTAMATMSRSIGLPARWVKGFAPGSLPITEYGSPMSGMRESFEINPNGQGTYTVRNADAHSWVEIYFDGYGWIPFEPTAGFNFPYTMTQDTQQQPTDLVPDKTETAVGTEKESLAFWNIGLWIVLSLLLVALVILVVMRRQTLLRGWKKFRFRSFSPNERIIWESEQLLRKCRRKGLHREEHETMREAIIRWSDSRMSLQGEFRELLDIFERAKYSSFEATNLDADKFTKKIKTIKEQL